MINLIRACAVNITLCCYVILVGGIGLVGTVVFAMINNLSLWNKFIDDMNIFPEPKFLSMKTK